MSVFRIVGLVAVLGSLVACADDTTDTEASSNVEKEPSSTKASSLSDGLGDDVPVPLPPGPWNDPDWAPPRVSFEGDRDHDPVGPMHACVQDYLKIYDPARSQVIEVPIVRCD